MNTYKRHRFPPEIISHSVWLYFRFNLSHRDVEDLLAERGIIVSYESVRYWCMKFGAQFARSLKRRHQGFGDTFFMDEVFVKIGGVRHYLWRAVDQDGEVVDVSFKSAGMPQQGSVSSNGSSRLIAERLERP
jgi:putative transposase